MKLNRLLHSAATVVITLLLFTTFASAGATYLISYGDSLSDNGNLYSVTGYPPYPYWNGRMSNGPVMVEHLAQNMGLQLWDFAWIGATTGMGNYSDGGTQSTFGAFGLPGMLTSVGATLPAITPIAPQSIAIVWGGPNDFLTDGFSPATAQVAVQDIINIVASLKGINTMTIVVPGMPDLGLTPDYLGDPSATALSVYFNSLLKAALPGDVKFFDTFGFMHQVVANPAAFGFTNVTQPCFDEQAQTVCSNPGEYLFWDGFHPTTTADAILAREIAGTDLPEPSTLIMLGTAVAGAAGALRRKLS